MDAIFQFPDLKWRWEHDVPVLKGKYHFSTLYKGVELKDTFNLRFHFPQDYPETPPYVEELDNNIPAKFHHYSNGTLCLCVPVEYLSIFLRSPTLSNFINNLLNPYLTSWLWYKQFGEMPWGERSHGAIGLCEFYAELLKIRNLPTLLPFLEKIILGDIPQRANCPCGSGVPYRNCHKKIVNKFLLRIPISNIREDYYYILQ